MLWMSSKQVEQVSTTPQFGYYEEFIVHAKDIEETNYVVVATKLPQYVYLLLQLRNVLRIVAEHDAFASKLLPLTRSTRSVTLRFAPGSNTNLTIRTLSNDQVTVKEISRSTLRIFRRRRRL